jgi:hypothetical protein
MLRFVRNEVHFVLGSIVYHFYIYFQIAVGGATIQIVHFFYHGYLEEEKSMIHSFTVTIGIKYLTGMVTSVPPY